MRKWLNNYFDLTKGEFNGLLVLVFLIIGVTLAPLTYSWLWPVQLDSPAERQAIQELTSMKRPSKARLHFPVHKTHDKAKKEAILYRFDPNTTDQQGWQQLGFSEKQAQSILKYVQKGGKFRKVEDLQKMYVVSPEAYEKLRPYVSIKATIASDHKPMTVFNKQEHAAYTPASPVMVEINRADTLELDKIKGIGPAFARRIVKYRERLGGFYKKEQLMEVFGLDSVKFNEIKDQINVDVSALKRLDINKATFEDFKNNPYLRYKQVNAILQYKQQHGNYGSFADLKKVAILTPQILENLAPYISFSP